MPVRIKKGSSRLTHSELVIVDGIEFWTRPNIPDVEADASDDYLGLEDNVRIDMVAQQKYRRIDWWWVLAHRNDYRLLPNDMIPGKNLIIPRASLVRKTLF